MSLRQSVGIIELQDQRNLPGVLPRHGLDESERRRIRVAARVDRQLHVIFRIVPGRIWGERPRRPVLEPLVDRQNHQLAGPGQPTMHQQPIDFPERARVVRRVPAEDLSNTGGRFHAATLDRALSPFKDLRPPC